MMSRASQEYVEIPELTFWKLASRDHLLACAMRCLGASRNDGDQTEGVWRAANTRGFGEIRVELVTKVVTGRDARWRPGFDRRLVIRMAILTTTPCRGEKSPYRL